MNTTAWRNRPMNLTPLLAACMAGTLLVATVASAQSTRTSRSREAGQPRAEALRAERTLQARALSGATFEASVVDVQTPLTTQISLWDGTDEDGLLYNDPETPMEAVQLVTLPEDVGTITDFTACFFFPETLDQFEYDVVVFRNNSGQPGNLLAEVPLLLDGPVPASDPNFGCDPVVGPVDIPVDRKRIFVGVRFRPVAFTDIGLDLNGPTTSPAFSRASAADAWEPLPDDSFPDFRNFAFELEFVSDGGIPTTTCEIRACVPSATNLCLQGDRFDVSATFVDQFGGSGDVQMATELTPDTGYGFFQDPTNVELVIKVLDACVPFNRFWVFAAGLTDQGITLRVCDRETGVLNIYDNPLKTPFAPIQDTGAFATCP